MEIIMKKNDPMKNADKILSSINSDKLKDGVEKLKHLSAAENAKLKKQLESIDKNKVLEMFNSLKPEQIKQKLGDLDMSKLSKLTKNSDIMNKLKKDKERK